MSIERKVIGEIVIGAAHAVVEEIEGQGQWAVIWHVEDDRGRGWDVMGRPQEAGQMPAASEGYLLRHGTGDTILPVMFVKLSMASIEYHARWLAIVLSPDDSAPMPPELHERESIVCRTIDGRRLGLSVRAIVNEVTKHL